MMDNDTDIKTIIDRYKKRMLPVKKLDYFIDFDSVSVRVGLSLN